jgi:hypothetical protein
MKRIQNEGRAKEVPGSFTDPWLTEQVRDDVFVEDVFVEAGLR